MSVKSSDNPILMIRDSQLYTDSRFRAHSVTRCPALIEWSKGSFTTKNILSVSNAHFAIFFLFPISCAVFQPLCDPGPCICEHVHLTLIKLSSGWCEHSFDCMSFLLSLPHPSTETIPSPPLIVHPLTPFPTLGMCVFIYFMREGSVLAAMCTAGAKT